MPSVGMILNFCVCSKPALLWPYTSTSCENSLVTETVTVYEDSSSS